MRQILWRDLLRSAIVPLCLTATVAQAAGPFPFSEEWYQMRADDPPGFEGVQASVDETTKTVTGSVFGLIRRRASLQEGYGCVLEP